MSKSYKVDLEGLLIEEVDSAVEKAKVEKIYGEKDNEDSLEGYIVNIPMKERFYKPKFDLKTYFSLSKHYENLNREAQEGFKAQLETYKRNYVQDVEEWKLADENSRSKEPPNFQPPKFIPFEEPSYSNLWFESLTPEEIHELLSPPEDEFTDFPNVMIKEINSIKTNMNKVETDITSSESNQEVTMVALTDIYEQLLSLQEKIISIQKGGN